MAVVNNATYCGKEATEYYTPVILGGDSLKYFKQFLNVKNQQKVANIEVEENVLQLSDCTFNAAGTTTLNEKIATVCDFKINREECVKNYEDTFLSEQIKAGSNHGDLPDALERFIVERVLLRAKVQLENLAWNGDTDGSDSTLELCDGLIKQMEADATVVDINKAVISETNVIAELTRVVKAIPVQVALSQDGKGLFKHKLFCSGNVVRSYRIALSNLAYGSVINLLGEKPLDFMGYELVFAPGLLDSNIVAVDPNNLWLFTDLMSDMTDIKLIPMMETTGAPNFRMVAGMKFGVGYGVGAEIVLYN